MAFRSRRRGAILLEVIMALTLMFITAAVVTGSLNVSFVAARGIANQALAEDLAVTKISELQMGLVPVADSGPSGFDEDPKLANWTWQIVTTQLEEQTIAQGPQLKRVEVIIRHAPTNLVQRMAIMLPEADSSATSQPADAGTAGGGA